MTAATTDRNTAMRDGEMIPVPMAAGVQIFAGTIVMVNPAGYAVPGITGVGLTYVGRADGWVDNRTGAAAAQTVLVRRGKAFKFFNAPADPINQAGLFKVAYVVDDQTVAATNGANTRSQAGVVHGIDADGVWIYN